MLAAQCNSYATAKVLLENNANVDVRDSENKTVLHYAIGSSDIVKEILKVSAREQAGVIYQIKNTRTF